MKALYHALYVIGLVFSLALSPKVTLASLLTLLVSVALFKEVNFKTLVNVALLTSTTLLLISSSALVVTLTLMITLTLYALGRRKEALVVSLIGNAFTPHALLKLIMIVLTWNEAIMLIEEREMRGIRKALEVDVEV